MTLSERIDQLERENQRMRRALSALAATFAAAVLMGAAAFEEPGVSGTEVVDLIRAKRVEIVGEDGSVAVELNHRDNFGRIALRDDQGRLAVWLAARPAHGGAIFTLNRGVNKLVELSATVDGQGVVSTYDSMSDRRLVDLIPNTRAGGAVVTYDGSGSRSMALSSSSDGLGVLAAYDRSGGLRKVWPDPYKTRDHGGTTSPADPGRGGSGAAAMGPAMQHFDASGLLPEAGSAATVRPGPAASSGAGQDPAAGSENAGEAMQGPGR